MTIKQSKSRGDEERPLACPQMIQRLLVSRLRRSTDLQSCFCPACSLQAPEKEHNHVLSSRSNRAHLDSLLMTRMRAAFSSLSLWLSARRSPKTWTQEQTGSEFCWRSDDASPLLCERNMRKAMHLQLIFQLHSSPLEGQLLL